MKFLVGQVSQKHQTKQEPRNLNHFHLMVGKDKLINNKQNPLLTQLMLNNSLLSNKKYSTSFS